MAIGNTKPTTTQRMDLTGGVVTQPAGDPKSAKSTDNAAQQTGTTGQTPPTKPLLPQGVGGKCDCGA